MNTILVADDEPEVRNYLGVALSCQGFNVEFAQNGEEVLSYLTSTPAVDVSVLVLDVVMPSKDGLETLKDVRRIRPELPVIMLSGAVSPINIVTAMKTGACDFLPKPVNHEDLRKAIYRALPALPPQPVRALPGHPSTGAADLEYTAVIGSPWSRKVEQLVQTIGFSDVPVLLQGETGVGKEVLARKIHAASPRGSRIFLKLNCAALPSELVESELFGYERGAFTGALKNTPGKFEMANGGTILLDEIGDMDVKLQAKLLQVLQDGEFMRLGAKDTAKVDVRIMAATHCDLEKAIEEHRFREDLYYRLNIIDIHIPALRERPEEILPLAEFFLRKYGTPGIPTPPLTFEMRRVFLEYGWPGNVRQLENIIRKFLVLRDVDLIVHELLHKGRRQAPLSAPVQAQPASPDQAPPLQGAQSSVERDSRYGVRPIHLESNNFAHRMPASSNGEAVGPTAAIPTPQTDVSILEKVDSVRKAAESEAILAALNSTLWNRKQAAHLLNIDYKALLYKMKKLGIGERTMTTTP
jgi:two-component system response regulator AtoC